MKLSHLSLAILSAIALAACGGSGSDDHTTDPNANKPGATDQTPKQPEDKKDEDKKEDTAKDDAKIVDPTGDQVVDNISLAKDPTTASQQYIRGEKSSFDRTANPSEPASATVLSGITLDLQNPQLTNIVIGRIQGKNKENKDVNVALFAGSPDSKMESVGGVKNLSLQYANRFNALVGGPRVGAGSVVSNSLLGYDNAGHWLALNQASFVSGDKTTLDKNSVLGGTKNVFHEYVVAYNNLAGNYSEYLELYPEYKKAVEQVLASGTDSVTHKTKRKVEDFLPIAKIAQLQSVVGRLNSSMNDYKKAYTAIGTAYPNLEDMIGLKTVKKPQTIEVLRKIFAANIDTAANPEPLIQDKSVLPLNFSNLNEFGSGLAWFTQDGTFTSDQGWGDYVDSNKKKVVGATHDDTKHVDAAYPTSGLVGIYRDNTLNKMVVRGSEDNNVRTTRIFGHYYRDPGSVDNLKITLNPEGYNSWAGARTFITGVDKDGVPNMYGLGVAPMTLNHVQYGRVTADINPMQLADRAESTTWVKERQDFANRDPEYKTAADNFYFYRGTDATTIKEMGALPTDTSIAYRGHALMYGVDNSFHGAGLNLPNAFGNEESYGIGSFVKANLNMGSKKFDGYIYNVWASKDSAAVKEDKLVEFSGDVTGNTVIGTANLAYDPSKTGDLRASFYGSAANEVGGAIDSVKRQDPYGPVGWGGVFGAQRESVGGVSSAWLTSSEKK